MVDIRSNSNEPTPSAGSNNFHRQSYPKFRNWLGLILAGEPSDTDTLFIFDFHYSIFRFNIQKSTNPDKILTLVDTIRTVKLVSGIIDEIIFALLRVN
ncbi:hypothetical protein V1477_006864 [Vespula maculifrons]|uniref:Uncharacterized protein n=1 Tax=Vespula maculifrons TaxID=7453 RepID=A0ABD2CGW7_VESMC